VKKNLLFALIALLVSVGIADAQVRVALRLDESRKPLWGFYQLCDEKYNCGLAADDQSKVSLGEGLLLKISRTGKDFNVVVDTNQNRSLADERTTLLRHSGAITVGIRKRLAAKRYMFMPFELQHEPPDEQGDTTDRFILRPRYVVSGTLTYGRCRSRISLFDINLDGKVTSADSERGTNLQIDRNNDGKFYGKEENRKSTEIIDFCGQNFLVTSLSSRLMTLTPTSLRVARVGEPVPDFSLALLDGQVVTAASLKGKYYVLDFWASWCIPCVKSLSEVKSIREAYPSVSVFSVNVDSPVRRRLAEQIVEDKGITDFTAIRGSGDDDTLWKRFGGASSNGLAIPLYVVIDKSSVIRYVGNGGEELTELKRELNKLLSTS
jgi:thiol-disulfide isomerase/thioredoxin